MRRGCDGTVGGTPRHAGTEGPPPAAPQPPGESHEEHSLDAQRLHGPTGWARSHPGNRPAGCEWQWVPSVCPASGGSVGCGWGLGTGGPSPSSPWPFTGWVTGSSSSHRIELGCGPRPAAQPLPPALVPHSQPLLGPQGFPSLRGPPQPFSARCCGHHRAARVTATAAHSDVELGSAGQRAGKDLSRGESVVG